MNLLFCTILRDSSGFVPNWAYQVFRLAEELNHAGHRVSLSVYENDSSDGSAQVMLKNLQVLKKSKLLDNIFWQSETINSVYHGHDTKDWHARVRNLSDARNKCINNALTSSDSRFDKVVFIEPDVSYNSSEATDLIEASPEYDILSGISILYPTSTYFYDSWATRFDKIWLPLGVPHENWNGHPERLQGIFNEQEKYVKLAATFSGVCVYKAKPFYEGVMFDYKYQGNPDCDTTVVCYNFSDAGYDRIFLNRHFKIFHFRDELPF